MNARPRNTLTSLLLSCVLLAGFERVSAASTDEIQGEVTYQPVPSPTRIDASVSLEATHAPSPQIRASWKARGHDDQAIERHCHEVAQALVADIADSGLFARIVATDGAVRPDYILRIRSESIRQPDFRLRVTISVANGATGSEISVHMREGILGARKSPNLSLSAVLPGLMAELKAAVAADIQPRVRAGAEIADRDSLRNASLADLLVSSDSTETIARERNRAIIAAKDLQLPAILREKKTDELSALVVKIEQTILDLNHECEVAKDQAQQSLADSGNPNDTSRIGRTRGQASSSAGAVNLEELRGLAISFRERIELLKPIGDAVKEEIANRNR